ncbi:GntR family transcriptional repressor for pyruvate dehydrogenase complex [Croceifilum oryzae]|uniref:GntR family transcriptional repressor for pyruvate dehydrogenase complex n=1 Tax=Croceifilum oryzae TaxID=1553429 RepID=A0AAJ1WS73_9BACL|nr:FCD domain-containing protein [Croceifilum oryzae]MDQ0416743.1 GntR family transcriptional repressor for pyruvate dehydrogenase complex [Croceifilum oryzae]
MKDVSSNKFHSILNSIHQLIEADGLCTGDRLPSERELSERLQVGRSTVREALRSLELLGIISTRRGEGTFLESSQSNHIVELLAKYILQGHQVLENLLETRVLLEMGAVWLLCDRLKEEDLAELFEMNDQLLQVEKLEQVVQLDSTFHERLVYLSRNHLLIRIWQEIMQFLHTKPAVLSLSKVTGAQTLWDEHKKLLTAIRERDMVQSLSLVKEHFSPSMFQTVESHSNPV